MIIGLGYRRGVGKNTVGLLLKEWLNTEYPNLKVELASFAKPMKDIAYQMYSWAGMQTAEYYEINYLEKEVVLPLINCTPRHVWIELGTTVGRAIFKKTWVNLALNAAKADVTIFTDARFPDELDAIQDANGLVFEIVNSNVRKHDDVADSAAKEYINWSGVIINNGTVEDLKKELEYFKTNLRWKLKEEGLGN